MYTHLPGVLCLCVSFSLFFPFLSHFSFSPPCGEALSSFCSASHHSTLDPGVSHQYLTESAVAILCHVCVLFSTALLLFLLVVGGFEFFLCLLQERPEDSHLPLPLVYRKAHFLAKSCCSNPVACLPSSILAPLSFPFVLHITEWPWKGRTAM